MGSFCSRSAKEAPNASPEDPGEVKRDPINRITVYVIQGRNLPKKDVGPAGKSDPYIKVTFGGLPGSQYKTKTIRSTLNPVWNGVFKEEGEGLFAAVNNIQFDLHDADRLSKDECVGRYSLEIQPQSDYVSPVQWLELVDQNGNAVKGHNGETAAIQISLQFEVHAENLVFRSWTHVLELTVKSAKNIECKDFLENATSETCVTVDCGGQNFKTHAVAHCAEPKWDQTLFLFVLEDCADEQIKLRMEGKDLSPRSLMGTGYLRLADIFEKCKDENPQCLEVQLHTVSVETDRCLSARQQEEEKVAEAPWGVLEVAVKLEPRKAAEKGFAKALIQTLDTNEDGVIDVEEAKGLLASLGGAPFALLDTNHDEKLDEGEIIEMLSDATIQRSELTTKCMALHLLGDLSDHQKHLMSGVTAPRDSRCKALKIKDRRTGLIVQEFIPQYVQWALSLLYDRSAGRHLVTSRAVVSLLRTGSRRKGKGMDSEKSAADIPVFVKQHRLDTRSLYKPVEEFRTFNEFFARGMNVDECRPLADPEDESVVVSPADCRMMAWDSVLDATSMWIKGTRFTLKNLLGPDSKVDLKKYEGGSFAIARLAPQDYHRWHYPIGGKVVNIEHVDGALYTVNPVAINKAVDVYTENKRAIIELDGGDNGCCVMFAIAATMVGSYYLFRTEAEDPTKDNPVALELGDEVKRGDVAGEFRFGGSTVLLLFEPGRVEWSEDIRRNVADQFETLITVRSKIATIKQAAAP